MVFTDDTDVALQAAVALANSTDEPGQPLGSAADLAAFITGWDYTGRHQGDDAELEDVRRLRPQLRTLLLAERDDAATTINTVLADARALPQLRRHGQLDWHFHVIDDERPLPERILVETAMAMVDVLRSGETSRLSTCEAGDCDDIVLDLSRNRSRRYCSTTCGNREAVSAYRARKKS